MTTSQQADQIIVLVDINDPMTFDKEFIRSVRYSPFVAGGTEMSERGRKSVRAYSDSVSELYKDKFILEIFTDKFGDFAAHFLANDVDQRALIYRGFRWEGVDDEDIPEEAYELAKEKGIDIEEMIEDDQTLIHVYELSTGPKAESGDVAPWEDPEEEEPATEDELLLAADPEEEEILEEQLEDIALSGNAFVVPAPKMLH